jgi:hypothetical protein
MDFVKEDLNNKELAVGITRVRRDRKHAPEQLTHDAND